MKTCPGCGYDPTHQYESTRVFVDDCDHEFHATNPFPDLMNFYLVKDFRALEGCEKNFDVALGYFLGRHRSLAHAQVLAKAVFPGRG